MSETTLALSALPTERYKRNVIRGKLDLVGEYILAARSSYQIGTVDIERECHRAYTLVNLFRIQLIDNEYNSITFSSHVRIAEQYRWVGQLDYLLARASWVSSKLYTILWFAHMEHYIWHGTMSLVMRTFQNKRHKRQLSVSMGIVVNFDVPLWIICSVLYSSSSVFICVRSSRISNQIFAKENKIKWKLTVNIKGIWLGGNNVFLSCQNHRYCHEIPKSWYTTYNDTYHTFVICLVNVNERTKQRFSRIKNTRCVALFIRHSRSATKSKESSVLTTPKLWLLLLFAF